jgi:hypothetical protein
MTRTCWIIAGPNGAGKTTFALEYLPTVVGCSHFINADLIAAGLAPLAPERELLAASRIFLSWKPGSWPVKTSRSKPPWLDAPICEWSTGCAATAGGWT